MSRPNLDVLDTGLDALGLALAFDLSPKRQELMAGRLAVDPGAIGLAAGRLVATAEKLEAVAGLMRQLVEGLQRQAALTDVDPAGMARN